MEVIGKPSVVRTARLKAFSLLLVLLSQGCNALWDESRVRISG